MFGGIVPSEDENHDVSQVPRLSFDIFGHSESCPNSPLDADNFGAAEFPLLEPVQDLPVLPQTDVASTRGANKKPKRTGRKKQVHSNNSVPEERRARRAESNRRFARESRLRKAARMKELEAEVRELRQQVDFYRVRLGKYELIEKHRSSFGYELYTRLANVTNDLGRDNEQNAKQIQKALAESFDKFTEERRAAIEQLARAMVEIVAPLPQRFFFWAAERNLELLDPEELSKAAGGLVPTEHMKIMVDMMKACNADARTYAESKVFFAASSVRVRGLVKQLIECQKCIQEEMKRVSWFIFQNYIPHIDLAKMQCMAPLVANMKLRPEFSDCSLYQLSQTDFGLSTSFLRAASECYYRRGSLENVH